jgi:hypothetical protein
VFIAPTPGGQSVVADGGSYGGELPTSTASGLRLKGRCDKRGIRTIDFGFGGFSI